MGGTGGSTGLLPSFTLGCGTFGGSSTSENVGPMQLINLKKVAYGIKPANTLAQDDPTFNHPELAGAAPAPVVNLGYTAPAAPCCSTPAAPAPAASGKAGSVKVEAPMPGTVLAIKAPAGTAVKAGDPVIILEAMKMENEIAAPADGVVASINVAQGATVNTGDVLATLN